MSFVFRETHRSFEEALSKETYEEPPIFANLLQALERDPESFYDAIKNILFNMLQHLRKFVAAKKSLGFFKRFCADVKRYIYDDLTSINQARVGSGFLKKVFCLLVQSMAAGNIVIRGNAVMVTNAFVGIGLEDLGWSNAERYFAEYEQMLDQLLRDRNTGVRLLAMHLIVETSEDSKKDTLLAPYLYFISNEPMFEIRKYLTEQISLDRDSIQYLSKNLRDKHDLVRYAAYARFKDLKLDEIEMDMRQRFICFGFTDRNEDIVKLMRMYVRKLFAESEDQAKMPLEILSQLGLDDLPICYESGFLTAAKIIVTEILDLPTLAQIATKLLKKIPSMTPGKESQPTRAELLIIRIILEYVVDQDNPEAQALQIIPECDILLKNIGRYKHTSDLFKLDQVIAMAMCSNLSDETVRQKLIKRLSNTLKHFSNEYPTMETAEEWEWVDYHHVQASSDRVFKVTPEQISDVLCRNINKLAKGYRGEFTRIMIEVINEVREPMLQVEGDSQLEVPQVSRMKIRDDIYTEVFNLEELLHQLESDKIDFVEQENFAQALATKEQINEVSKKIAEYNQDLQVLDADLTNIVMRCLLIATGLYKFTKKSETESTHQELMKSLIEPCLNMKNINIKSMALQCKSLYALLDQDAQDAFMPIYDEILSERGEDLHTYVTLRALFDIFLAYPRLQNEDFNRELGFESEFENSISNDDILNKMIYYIDFDDRDTSPCIRMLAIEGFAKLLILGMIPNAAGILTKVMLQFFDEKNTADETKQILSVFLRSYTAVTEYNATTFIGAYKRLIAIYIRWLRKNVCTSNLNFTKIFGFSNSLLSPEYLRQAQAKYTPSRHYGFEIWCYVAFSALKDNSDCRMTEASLDAYLKILEICNLHGVQAKQVSILKKITKAIRYHFRNRQIGRRSFDRIQASIQEIKQAVGSVKDVNYENEVRKQFESDKADIGRFLEKYNSRNCHEFYTPRKRIERYDEEEDYSDEEEDSDFEEIENRSPRSPSPRSSKVGPDLEALRKSPNIPRKISRD